MTEIIYIPASMGNLYGILRTQAAPSPLLILSHGFGGSHTNHQDYEKFFCENGMATFNLDFCGGGLESKSDGSIFTQNGFIDFPVHVEKRKGDDPHGKTSAKQ